MSQQRSRRRSSGTISSAAWSGSIGEGPIATVYSGHIDGPPVAFKVLSERLDRRTLAVVEREQATLATLARTCAILPVEEIDQLEDGRHVLRMELCRESLDDVVSRVGALDPDDVLHFGLAIATALAAAHAAGVVHGGVKPSNVLFRVSGEPVLADFGVALRKALPLDIERLLDGLAPETLRTDTLDQATDLYGLGAVLYIALTGDPLLPSKLGERLGDRMLRRLRTPVPEIDRPGVPAELSALVAQLLVRDPARRPPGAAWVAERLAELIPGAPRGLGVVFPPVVWPGAEDQATELEVPVGVFGTFAPPRNPLAEPKRRVGARRLLPLVGAGIACLAVGALAVRLLGDSPPPTPVAAQLSPTPVASPSASTVVEVVLAPPVDLGTQAVLSWSTPRPMDYGVVVAPEGEGNHVVLAQRTTTMKVPVDPTRRYCFQVQATDGNEVYTSRAVSMRGAVCG